MPTPWLEETGGGSPAHVLEVVGGASGSLRRGGSTCVMWSQKLPFWMTQSSSPRPQCTRFPLCRLLNFPFSVPLPCFVDSTPLHNIYPSSTYCVTDAADLHMSLLQFSGRPAFNYVKFTLSIITLSNSLLWPRAGSKHSINREQYHSINRTVSTVSTTVLTKNIINSFNSEKN